MLCRARPCNCSLSNACVWSGLGQQVEGLLAIAEYLLEDLGRVLRSGMAAQIYDIRAIPNTLLIDPKGNIVGKGMTHEQIEALLNK